MTYPLKAKLTRCRHSQALVVLESEPFNGLEIRPDELRALAQQLTTLAEMSDCMDTRSKYWRETRVSVDANAIFQVEKGSSV